MSEIVIEKARSDDSLEIARLHKNGITKGFLSQQTDEFLSALYKHLIENEIVFVARKNNEVLGFVAGTVTTSGLFKSFLLKNKSLLIKFATSNIFSRSFVRKCFETFFAPMRMRSDAGKGLPELLSIVVDKKASGKGIGKELVNKLDIAFKNKGILKYKIIVGSELEANKFYQNNGFEKIGEVEIHRGALSYIYSKDLKDI